MSRIPLILSLGLCSALLMIAAPVRAQAADFPSAPTATLEWQIQGLSTLQDLDLTDEQLKSLATAAEQTAMDLAAAPAIASNPSPAYHSALLALRDALAAADDDKIGDAQDKVDDLREKLKIPPLPLLPPTDAANTKSRSILRLLSSGQIADYLAMHADDVPDAGDTLQDALDQCHDGSQADYAGLRDQAAAQVALLAAGADERATEVVTKRVCDLLDRARQMSPDEFESHRAEFDRAARAITRAIDSFEALHRWMLNQIAVLLSNPQLTQILDMRRSAERQS
jgi:hypothetical protein